MPSYAPLDSSGFGLGELAIQPIDFIRRCAPSLEGDVQLSFGAL